jgi:zinc protease
MSATRRLCAARVLVFAPLLLAGAGRPRHAPSSYVADTLTTAYDVSGVRVLQRRTENSDIVAVRLYLLGGTRQITERTAGIEPLLLHAAAYHASRALDRTGSILTLEPGADWTVYGFTGLVDDLDDAWHAFADRLMQPNLSDEALARARGQLLTRARRRYTEPDQRLHVIAMRALFRDHPYALDPEGTEASLAALTAEDLRAYARDQLVRSRMLLAVVGAVTRAHLESLVTATLGRLPRGAYRWTLPPAPRTHSSAWLIENRELPTAYILGLFPGPPPTAGQRYWAFRVATAVLSGQIHYHVRQEHSLSYAAYAPFYDQAIPVGGAYVSTPRPDEALALLHQAIREIATRRFDRYSLGRFIDSYRFNYLVDNATAQRQADFLARAELYLGSFRKGEESLQLLHRVLPEDLAPIVYAHMGSIQYAYLGDTTRMHGQW